MDERPITAIEDRLEITVRIAATNLTGLLYAVVILKFFGFSSSVYKLLLFSSILVVLPLLSAVTVRACRQASPQASRLIDLANNMIVIVCGCSLAGLSIVTWLFKISLPTADIVMRWGLSVLACAHFGLLVVALCANPERRSRLIFGATSILTGGYRFSESLCFVVIFSVAMMLAFYIGQGNPFLNVSFSLIGGLNPKAGWTTLILAPIFALSVLVICFVFLIEEQEFQTRKPSWMSIRWIAPVVAIVAVTYFYFDFKFDTDVLHFLTNAGPASQIVFAGSVPMVTAFSQYGPGPLVMTWLSFLISSPSFPAANILSQVHSIAFYSVILLCLHRMTSYRVAALWLGFFAVGVLLAGWWGGNGSLNSLPSSMGMRYLPNGILVLAISYLPNNRRLSAPVLLAVLLSALWSFETLAGSVAILGLFLLIRSVSERDVTGFFGSLLVGIIIPVVAAIALTSCATLVWAGKLPDYLAYLQFALVYNMTSEFWSIDASGAFLGWIPVAVAAMVVLTLAWLSAIEADKPCSPFSSDILIYRFAPMAALVGFMSSYFAGRSVDFTLIVSFLPFSAIVIPAMLAVFNDAMSVRTSAIQLAIVPVLVVFVALSFSFSALYRKGAPYSTAISECLYMRNCTPVALAKAAAQRSALRPMLDQAANPNFFETSGLAEESIRLIQRYASDRRKIPLFLGIHPTTIWSVHTNMVLILTGKGHRWPISYVLSDEINPRLEHKIVNADVRLEEGEAVFIRSDESRLGKLETAIVARIRSNMRLCPLEAPGGLVTAYRATFKQHCDQGT